MHKLSFPYYVIYNYRVYLILLGNILLSRVIIYYNYYMLHHNKL